MELRSLNELQIQRLCWETIWKAYPEARRLFFHVPNEAAYDNSQQASSGVVPGVPDMLFAWNKNTWYIELKDEDGKVGRSQKVFHSQLDRQGIKTYLFYNAEDCIKFLVCLIDHKLQPDVAEKIFAEFISPFSNGEMYETYLAEEKAAKLKAKEQKAARGGFKFKIGVKKKY